MDGGFVEGFVDGNSFGGGDGDELIWWSFGDYGKVRGDEEEENDGKML